MKRILIVMLVSALAACGGGDDNAAAPAATQEVPSSASASVTGLIDYLRALVASAADTLEPVDVSVVTPPSDDTLEPVVID
jgi:hypothetical protein